MTPVMYSMTVPVFERMLGNLSAILDKGAAHAQARKIEPSILLNARLYPDMLPLTSQVRIACDFAKGATARLAGAEPPKYDDNEATFDELKARIAKTIDFVRGHAPEQFAGAEERTVEMKLRGEAMTFKGLPYLARVVLPNFYFHATTAYDILRHNGVELGKRDYVGPLP
jgi:uncharacterized protein